MFDVNVTISVVKRVNYVAFRCLCSCRLVAYCVGGLVVDLDD